MSALTDRLNEWAALAEKATVGPWTTTYGPHELSRVWASDDDAESLAVLGGYVDRSQSESDAAFIAASRTTLPALVEALRAVLELHKPRSFWTSNPDDERMWRTRDEAHEHKRADVIEPEEVTLCEACMRTAYEYDDGETVSESGYGESVEWPCPTVDTVATALGVTP